MDWRLLATGAQRHADLMHGGLYSPRMRLNEQQRLAPREPCIGQEACSCMIAYRLQTVGAASTTFAISEVAAADVMCHVRLRPLLVRLVQAAAMRRSRPLLCKASRRRMWPYGASG